MQGSEAGAREEHKVYVMANTAYNSCCIDEVGASYVGSECVVHNGHACMSPTSNLPDDYYISKFISLLRDCGKVLFLPNPVQKPSRETVPVHSIQLEMLSLRTSCSPLPRLDCRRSALYFGRTKRKSVVVMSTLTRETVDVSLDVVAGSRNPSFPLLFNGCPGNMGKAVVEAAVSAGLELVPVSFTVDRPGRILEIADIGISIHDPSEGEKIIPSVLEKYPDVVVVDFTAPDAVNANAEMYCKFGLPFVMGTTGGNRELLYKTVQDANVYSVISP